MSNTECPDLRRIEHGAGPLEQISRRHVRWTGMASKKALRKAITKDTRMGTWTENSIELEMELASGRRKGWASAVAVSVALLVAN